MVVSTEGRSQTEEGGMKKEMEAAIQGSGFEEWRRK